jgi:hypothetical protein
MLLKPRHDLRHGGEVEWPVKKKIPDLSAMCAPA